MWVVGEPRPTATLELNVRRVPIYEPSHRSGEHHDLPRTVVAVGEVDSEVEEAVPGQVGQQRVADGAALPNHGVGSPPFAV